MTGHPDLVLEVERNDVRAFEALYARYSERAYRLASGITTDDGRAQELVEDAFVSVWRRRAEYAPERGSVASWIMIAVWDRGVAAGCGDGALPTLPQEQRDVIVLAHFGGLTVGEIACALSISRATVKRRMRLGLGAMEPVDVLEQG